MSQHSPKRPTAARPPLKDRRAPPDANGAAPALRQLRGLLVRPIALERRNGKLAMVLVDRRKAGTIPQEPTTAELCKELGARLMAHDPGHATQSVRYLMKVHDMLGRKGWPGVAALPAMVLARSARLAQMMATEDPSPLLDDMLARMDELRIAAEAREEREARMPEFELGRSVQVSETDLAEFDDLERGWEGTVPDSLVRVQRDD
ncbi:MAG: hypothetical protein U1E89_12615 [Burkholderiaceae bacterium]